MRLITNIMSSICKTIININPELFLNNQYFVKKRLFSNFVNPKLPDNNDLFKSFLAGIVGSMLTLSNRPSNIEKNETLSMFRNVGFVSFGISVCYFLRYLKKF